MMISLNFQIDKSTLAFNTLCSYTKDYSVGDNCKAVVTFMQRAHQIDPETCYLTEYTLCERSLLLQYGPNEKSIADLMLSLETLAAKLTDEPSFEAILKETEQARSKLAQEWKENAEASNKIMADLTGLPLNEHMDVYVVHPCFVLSLAKSKTSICCTCRERYPNYNTQNLWYNILAVQLETEDRLSAKGRAAHAVLDLLFLELKSRLSGKPNLSQGKGDYNHLLPSWQVYLQQKGTKDIHQYIDAASQVLKQLPEKS
jgi:hypothetical protein